MFITYSPASGFRPARAQVIRPGYRTDPGAHWTDGGNKTFNGVSSESVPAAKAWASAQYGIKNWKRNRMRDWIDADAGLPPLRKLE